MRLFRNIILKVTLIYAAGAIVGVLALDRLFGGYEFYLGTLVFIAPLLAWVETFMLVPKNLDWILALPISKRNVLVLHYLTSLFASFVTILATIFVLLVLTLVKSGVHLGGEHLRSTPPSFVSHAPLLSLVSDIDIYGWMSALLMLSFFHALSMSISRPMMTKRLYLNLWNDSNPTVRWLVRTGWLGAIAAAALLRECVLAPFGIFVMATFVFLLLTTFNTTYALGVPRSQRNRWLALSAGVALVQIVFLFTHAMRGVHSASFDRRVASVMFLGPLSGGIAKPDLIKLLEADLSQDRIEELGEHYKKNFSGGHRIRIQEDHDVSFERAIAQKKSFAALVSTLGLFDASELGFAEVSAFFDRAQPLAAECRCEFNGPERAQSARDNYYYELLSSRLHWSEVVKLLKSRNDLAIRYGLLWARYHGKPNDSELVPLVEAELSRYPDRLKLEALATLSILGGERFTFDDWIRLKLGARGSGRVLSSAGRSNKFDVDCADWVVNKVVSDLAAEDVGALNYCIRNFSSRQKIDPTQVGEIEALGWLEPPFDQRARNVVRRVLRIK